ncbi:uncharacterized protein LOC119766197 [Culex quinquefasciatus]|uniref:uncharacterized protein LOC119766197 n=1 Tax=Culex quinquefasciatus TaxID=7176 RepID=UPI0018E3D804|nr:uncharacterized protein LOC119766197 [Culex quinquefasciatus]
MEAESISLRSWNQAFLVGNLEGNLPLHRTPTNRELLSALLHRNRYNKLSIKNAALEISRLAESALNAHLQDLYDTWRGLYKQKSRTTSKSEEDRIISQRNYRLLVISSDLASSTSSVVLSKSTSSNKSDLANPSSSVVLASCARKVYGAAPEKDKLLESIGTSNAIEFHRKW